MLKKVWFMFVLWSVLMVSGCSGKPTEDMERNVVSETEISEMDVYDEYYPYDGCGYYSVFVETNLNLASTISEERLCSEEDSDSFFNERVKRDNRLFCVDISGRRAF